MVRHNVDTKAGQSRKGIGITHYLPHSSSRRSSHDSEAETPRDTARVRAKRDTKSTLGCLAAQTLGLLLACLTLAAPAHANYKGEGRLIHNPGLRADLSVAYEYWGRKPSCRTLRIETEPAWLRGPDYYGWATRDWNEDGRGGDCRAGFKWRMSPCRRRYTAVHEVGHLLGLEHSSDPTNVMYPNLPYVCPWIGGS